MQRTLSEEELSLLQDFRAISTDRQRLVRAMVADLAKSHPNYPPRHIPAVVVPFRIPAK